MKKNIGILTFFLSIFIFGFLIFKPAFSADTASLLPNAIQQFFDSNGNPLSSGKIYFYEVGTDTFKDVYNSSDAATPYTNPITLNAGGKPPGSKGIYGIGLYRQLVKDKNGNTIWDAVTAPGGGGGGTPTDVGDGNLVGTILPWSGLVAPNQYVFTYGQEIVRDTYPEFFTAITLQSNVICTAFSNTLTGLVDTSQIPIGAPVELALCVPPGSTVVSKTSGTVTLNNPANVSLNATARFFPYGNGNGSTTFNVPDFRGATLIGRNNMGGSASSRLINGNSIGQVLALTPTTYTISQSSVSLTSGSGTFSVGSNVSRLHIRMVAGGGGGGAISTNAGSNGSDTSFGTWTAVHGNGGNISNNASGAGGTGGVDGTGTKITRIAGQNGSQNVQAASAFPGFGGNSYFGGSGVARTITNPTAGVNASANSGSGGSGASDNTNGSSGGGAGEYVEFYITNPVSQYSYTVGAGGSGGAAGGVAGGNGAAGQILIEATYGGNFADVLTPSTSGTTDYSITANYIIKITPDTSTSIATGVYSIGGMSGVISCGTGILCTGNIISFNGNVLAQGSTGSLQFKNSDGSFGGSPNAIFISPNNLTLGSAGTSFLFDIFGSSSGRVRQTVPAIAGTTNIAWGNSSGTPAVTASLPIVLNTTTGNLTCPTCATSTLNGAALTASNDTNITLTLGGTPSTSLLNAASIAAGWTGTLAAGRLNSNVVQSVTNDTNITGSISAQNLTLGWAGQLAVGRGGTGLSTGVSGAIPYFNSTNTMASSGVLGANQIMIGGGAGSAPSTITCSTTTTIVHGGTPPSCSQIVAGDITTNTITNSNLAQVTAATFKGNPTASTANIQDFTIQGLTQTISPNTTADFIPIYDSATGTIKKVTPGTIATSSVAGVSSLNSQTGALILTANSGLNLVTGTGTITITPDIATFSDFYAGTSQKLLDANDVFSPETTTTYGTTTTFDFNTFINTKVTLTGNITTMNCSNMKQGQAGTIAYIQDGVGSRTAAFNTGSCSNILKFPNATYPTLTTSASAIDILSYSCRSNSYCAAALSKGYNP